MLCVVVKVGILVGLQVKVVMECGELVLDVIVFVLIGEEFDVMGVGIGVIFDGYFCIEVQVYLFDVILLECGCKFDYVVEFEVNEDVLVECIIGCFICVSCGKGYYDCFEQFQQEGICDKCGGYEFKCCFDDNEEIVCMCMVEYCVKIVLILLIYDVCGIVVCVDGMVDMDDVIQVIEVVFG